MLTYNVSIESLYAIAESLDMILCDIKPWGQAWQFSLRAAGLTWRSERNFRIWSVGMNGHHAFFSELFRQFPDARVKTAMCRYNGQKDFHKQNPRTHDLRTIIAQPENGGDEHGETGQTSH